MSQRVAHTCTECSRRKIRCDKKIPCNNCTKRGNVHLCRKAGTAPPKASQNDGPTLPNLVHGNKDNDTAGGAAALNVVAALADRVKQLETALQSQKRPIPDDSADLLPTGSDAPVQSKYPRLSQAASNRSSPSRKDEGPDYESSSADSVADAEVENAATVLEFLAWGRLKSDYPNAINQNDLSSSVMAETDTNHNTPAWGRSSSTPSGGGFSTAESLGVQAFQTLLPAREQVFRMFDFHESWLLWVHNSFHGPSFRRELEEFYINDRGIIAATNPKLQWTALLFAILSTSLVCAKPSQVALWGFRQDDHSALAKQWYHCAIECMQTARYEQTHCIYSVQAICTMTWSAHLLGLSNTQSVLLSSAVRIAQSLGLHRLNDERRRRHQDNDNDLASRIQMETGRRVWQQLAQQDWFSVPFSETYCINPLHYTSKLPLNCDDKTMDPLPDSRPATTTYGNFLHEIASLMPKLLDKSSEAPSLRLKYDQVLQFDRTMRDLATYQLPPSLNSQIPMEPTWPRWVSLARRSLTITSAHKIIMIHRRFLGMSFTDQRFAFTRRTCLAAAKTILSELRYEQDRDAPILWTMQAFGVAAAIILALDNFNRHHMAPECTEHRHLITQTINLLSSSANVSSIASRGVRILGELLAEETARAQNLKKAQAFDRDKQTTQDANPEFLPKDRKASLNVSEFVKKFCESDQAPPVTPPLVTAQVPLWLRHDYQPQQRHPDEMYYSSNPAIGQFATPQQSQYNAVGFGPLGAANDRSQSGVAGHYPAGFVDGTENKDLQWINDLLGFPPSQLL